MIEQWHIFKISHDMTLEDCGAFDSYRQAEAAANDLAKQSRAIVNVHSNRSLSFQTAKARIDAK